MKNIYEGKKGNNIKNWIVEMQRRNKLSISRMGKEP